MSKFDKLVQRFLTKPKNFICDELVRLLKGFGYQEQQGAGSRVVFNNEQLQHGIKLHKPHPSKILKRYLIDLIIDELKIKKLL